jgi:hypothetical protein
VAMRWVPPLLLAAVIVAAGGAPAAARRVEVVLDGKRDTDVTAKSAKAPRGASSAKKRQLVNKANAPRIDNSAKARRLVNSAKGRPPAKAASGGNASQGPTGSRARSLPSAAKVARGANGQLTGATGDGNASKGTPCTPDARQQLESSVTGLGVLAGGMGICQMAQESVRLHTALATYHRRCVPGRKGEARASEYDRAAAQAEETARARCTTVTLPPSPPSQVRPPQPPRPIGPSRQDRGGTPGIIAVR